MHVENISSEDIIAFNFNKFTSNEKHIYNYNFKSVFFPNIPWIIDFFLNLLLHMKHSSDGNKWKSQGDKFSEDKL